MKASRWRSIVTVTRCSGSSSRACTQWIAYPHVCHSDTHSEVYRCTLIPNECTAVHLAMDRMSVQRYTSQWIAYPHVSFRVYSGTPRDDICPHQDPMLPRRLARTSALLRSA